MTTQLEYEIERMRDFARHNKDSEIGYAVEQRNAEIIKNLRTLGSSDDFIEKAIRGGI